MPRQIQLNISLTPTRVYDKETNRHIIFYNEFPQAIATGSNEDEAERNLAFLVEDMWQKQSTDLKKYLLENYNNAIKINVPA